MTLNELEQDKIDEIRRTHNAIKTLEGEKKLINEDIGEEKKKCAKEVGIDVKELNNLFKYLKLKDAGFEPDNYKKVAENIEAHDSYIDDDDTK
jgi:uncharacterized protein (UPF0335 family)